MLLHVGLRKESSQIGIPIEWHQAIDVIESLQAVVVQGDLIASRSAHFHSEDPLGADGQQESLPGLQLFHPEHLTAVQGATRRKSFT